MFHIWGELNGGLTVVSADVFRNIAGNVRLSAALSPTHGK